MASFWKAPQGFCRIPEWARAGFRWGPGRLQVPPRVPLGFVVGSGDVRMVLATQL